MEVLSKGAVSEKRYVDKAQGRRPKARHLGKKLWGGERLWYSHFPR
jgi:hypothetical protein